MRVKAAILTHVGGRSHNEDAVLCQKLFSGDGQQAPELVDLYMEPPWFVAVADGMGGYGNGAFASRHVLEFLGQVMPNTAEEWLLQTVLAHRNLLQIAETRALGPCGTTLAALAVGHGGLLAVNIGDSRIYRADGNYLTLVSADDSEFLRMADSMGTGAEIGNILRQAIGGPPGRAEPKANIRSLAATTGRFLLCSDGVTDTLSLEEIESSVCSSDLSSAAASLHGKITNRKMLDNFSFIILDLP
ncbi:MAG: PP2C family serine/threonine-protein phosphatase [Verrucomicrobiota bacterium]